MNLGCLQALSKLFTFPVVDVLAEGKGDDNVRVGKPSSSTGTVQLNLLSNRANDPKLSVRLPNVNPLVSITPPKSHNCIHKLRLVRKITT